MRGKVFAFETGSCVSVGRDLGAGWKYIAAIRKGKELRLFINGTLAASRSSDGPVLDMECDAPLRIGFGPQGYFDGKIRDVRIYDRALSEADIIALCNNRSAKKQ